MKSGTVPAPTPESRRPAALRIFEEDVGTHRLSRRVVVTADGARRQIFLARPVREAPPAGYPVLYMLDGNAAFDSLTPALLAATPDLLLVGVGYDTPLRFDVFGRVRDYTPSRDGGGPAPDPERPDRIIGGAAAFLDLLCGELRTAGEAGVPVDPHRRAIWGHSLAGLFVLNALLCRPHAFHRYIAISPSVWWGDEWLLGREAQTLLADVAAEVLVMLGDSERRSSPAGPHWDGPAPHTLAMIRRLSARPQLAVSSQVLAGLGHAETQPASLPRALAFAAA